MKKIILLIIFLFSLQPTLTNAAENWNLIIMTVSGLEGQLLPSIGTDIHGKKVEFGGIARLATVLGKYRVKFPGKTITMSSGDDIMGMLTKKNSGKIILEVMNKSGYDISTLGNHELSSGSVELAHSLKYKKFPTVACNLNISKNNILNKFITPWTIININNIRLGVIGVANEHIETISNPGPAVKIIPNTENQVRKIANYLKKNNLVDIILMLNHLDLNRQKKLIKKIPQVDIACGGQDHTIIMSGEETVSRKTPYPGIVVQSGNRGRNVGILKLKISNGSIIKHKWEISPVNSEIAENPLMKEFIVSLTSKMDKEKLAKSNFSIDTRINFIRSGESPIGHIVSNIMRNKFNTDIAFQNSGGIRGDKVIPAGEITAKDINTMFPFGNTITICKIDGITLKQILEKSVADYPQKSGALLQLSGVHYTFNPDAQQQILQIDSQNAVTGIKTAGNRISNIKILNHHGKFIPLEENHKYLLATNSFLANGGDGYFMLKNLPNKVETFITVYETIKEGFAKLKVIKRPETFTAFDGTGKPFFLRNQKSLKSE